MKVTDGAKVFIKNRKLNKYLFCLRDDKPEIPNPNCWSLFGGGIEDGETPIEALKREIGEETNIEIYDIELIDEREITLFVKDKLYKVTGNIFLAYTDAEIEDIEIYEGQRVGYFSLDEVSNLKNIASTMPVFLKLYKERLK